MLKIEGYKKVNDTVLISTKEICLLLEISDRTLTDWKKQGLIQHGRGWWDLKNVLKWRGEIYNADSEVSQSVNLQQKKLEAEVKLKVAQSELTRIKTDIANGKYIEINKVEDELTRFFIVFKKSAMNLSRKIGGEISSYLDAVEARKIEQNLTETINDALEQMSIDGVYHGKKRRNTS